MTHLVTAYAPQQQNTFVHYIETAAAFKSHRRGRAGSHVDQRDKINKLAARVMHAAAAHDLSRCGWSWDERSTVLNSSVVSLVDARTRCHQRGDECVFFANQRWCLDRMLQTRALERVGKEYLREDSTSDTGAAHVLVSARMLKGAGEATRDMMASVFNYDSPGQAFYRRNLAPRVRCFKDSLSRRERCV